MNWQNIVITLTAQAFDPEDNVVWQVAHDLDEVVLEMAYERMKDLMAEGRFVTFQVKARTIPQQTGISGALFAMRKELARPKKKPWIAPICFERSRDPWTVLARINEIANGIRNATMTTVRPDIKPPLMDMAAWVGGSEGIAYKPVRYSDRAMQDADEIAGQLLGTR